MTTVRNPLRWPAKSWAWAVGLVTFILSAGFCLHAYDPELSVPLHLEISLGQGAPDSSEPILVTGQPGAADFLAVKYLDENTVAFGYDSWGMPGAWSQPIHFEPNVRRPLQIEMPGLSHLHAQLQPASKCLRIVYNGSPVLDEEVESHPRTSKELYFGENPNGGSSCGPIFHGKLYRTDGREIHGGIATYFTMKDRLVGWLTKAWLQVVSLLAFSAIIGTSVYRLSQLTLERIYRLRGSIGDVLYRHRWFVVCAAICWFVFSYVLTYYGRGHVIYHEVLGSFYDFQATSLLQRRLDVPNDAISVESFVFEGKIYGYFGLTPALLRIPFVIFRIAFGQLSRVFMLVEYLACLIAAYLILRRTYTITFGNDSIPSPWAIVLFTANVGLGSTLFFLSSRAYVYHEAILCGMAFALASSYCTLRYAAAPERRWWIGSLLCGTLSVHARPPVGLFALSFLGASALAVLIQSVFSNASNKAGAIRRRLPSNWAKHIAIGLLSVVGTLSFNGVSYLKFKSFDGAPLKYHVQYNTARLARTDGKNFHLNNIPLNFGAYLLRPLWAFRPEFPYIYAQGHSPSDGSKAKIDIAEPMLGLPFAMPGLFWLAAGGLIGAFWRFRQVRLDLFALVLGVVPMALALFAAIATSQRYTADFCPFLICAAAYGFPTVDALTRRWRFSARALANVLTGAAILITLAITLHYQGEITWGVPDEVKQDYSTLRTRMDRFFGIQHHDPQ